MKNIILSAIIMAIALTSCNQKAKEGENKNTTKTTQATLQLYSCSMHPEIKGKKGATCSKCGMELTVPVKQSSETPKEDNTSSKEVVNEKYNNSKGVVIDQIDTIILDYIYLKNKLANDDTNGAAEEGKQLFASFKTVNVNSLNAKQKAEYLDIADDAKEHAEHIGLNGGNISHQREHFASLSKDISDLITLLGSNQKLYQDYCPMYDNGKGAVWISKTKEIENPYFGKKMSTCGSIKKEF